MQHRKNEWVYALLLLFFGTLGAHKFYIGQIGMGILYLLTGGLGGIGPIIDFFAFAFGTDDILDADDHILISKQPARTLFKVLAVLAIFGFVLLMAWIFIIGFFFAG